MRHVIACVIGLGCVLLGAHAASAEWFGDLFVGPTFTRSDDVKIEARGVGRGTLRDVEFDTAVSGGIRVGHYFDAVPFLGIAVDAFQFYPNIGPQSTQLEGCFVIGGCGTRQGGTGSYDVSTTAVSVDLMLRLPFLKTTDAPRGMIQPYIAGGIPLFVTEVSPRNTRLFRNHASDTDFSIGYKAAAGVAVQVFKTIAVFVEYRFNHANVDVELQDSVSAAPSTFRTDLDSHSTLIGISARW